VEKNQITDPFKFHLFGKSRRTDATETWTTLDNSFFNPPANRGTFIDERNGNASLWSITATWVGCAALVTIQTTFISTSNLCS